MKPSLTRLYPTRMPVFFCSWSALSSASRVMSPSRMRSSPMRSPDAATGAAMFARVGLFRVVDRVDWGARRKRVPAADVSSLVGELMEDLTRGRGCGVAFGRPLVRPVDPQGEDAVGGRKSHVARGCARVPDRLRGRVSTHPDCRTDRVNRDWQRCVG